MIWVFDMHTTKSCPKMLWVSFSICLQVNMKKAEQFGFVSGVMELDHSHSHKRYLGKLNFFKWLFTTTPFLFNLHFVLLCFLEFVRALAEFEPAC